MMVSLYLALLGFGVIGFLAHFYAQLRVAQRLRQQHSHQWQIIAVPEGGGKASTMRIWMRLQLALRSPVLPLLDDPIVTRWRRIWRYAPWLAWIAWFAAMALQWTARSH